MSWNVCLLLAGAAVGGNEIKTHFENYSIAYQIARQTGRPMLVILNPAKPSRKKPILLEDVRRTSQRRQLLEQYVVVVLDAGTEHGRVMHKLFGAEKLPRVSIIDKAQKYQIFQTSEELYGQLWTQILEAYRNGEQPETAQPGLFCPT